MDYKFLNKVLGQIVSETTIDYDKETIRTPFPPFHIPLFILSYAFSSYRSPFTKHCNEVYGLNIEEIEYVWNEYREIIIDKIMS